MLQDTSQGGLDEGISYRDGSSGDSANNVYLAMEDRVIGHGVDMCEVLNCNYIIALPGIPMTLVVIARPNVALKLVMGVRFGKDRNGHFKRRWGRGSPLL